VEVSIDGSVAYDPNNATCATPPANPPSGSYYTMQFYTQRQYFPGFDTMWSICVDLDNESGTTPAVAQLAAYQLSATVGKPICRGSNTGAPGDYAYFYYVIGQM
jgi:hypothetical protein